MIHIALQKFHTFTLKYFVMFFCSMAGLKRKSTCLAVRSGKHSAKFLGTIPKIIEPPTRFDQLNELLGTLPDGNNTDVLQQSGSKAAILNLPYDCLMLIFKYLNSLELTNMFIVHTQFELAAIDTFIANWRDGKINSLKIVLSPKPEDFGRLKDNVRVLKAFGMYATTIKIIGYVGKELAAVDFDLLKEIVRFCPIVTSLTVVHFNTDEIFKYLRQFQCLTSVDFLFSRVGREVVLLPHLTEFIGNITPSEVCRLCLHCNNNVLYSNFINFFSKNPQINNVTLHVIKSKYCPCNCNMENRMFVKNIREYLSQRPMNSFKIYLTPANAITLP